MKEGFYPHALHGEWIRVPSDNVQGIACCDCGLAHIFEFRIRDGLIEWRAGRDEEATALIREADKDDERRREILALDKAPEV